MLPPQRADALSGAKAGAEELQRSAEEQVKELEDQNWQLKERLAELENQRKELHQENKRLQGEVALLEARIARGEVSSKAGPPTYPALCHSQGEERRAWGVARAGGSEEEACWKVFLFRQEPNEERATEPFSSVTRESKHCSVQQVLFGLRREGT